MKTNLLDKLESLHEFWEIGSKWTRDDVRTILEILEYRLQDGISHTDDLLEFAKEVLTHSLKIHTIDALWERYNLGRYFGTTSETERKIMDDHPSIIDIIYLPTEDIFILLKNKEEE